MRKKDLIFRLLVYAVSIYLMTTHHSVASNICGCIILLAHLYKDTTHLTSWPSWCECGGIVIATILIQSGIHLQNRYIVTIGLLKLAAHLRQCILQDNRYYY